MPELTRREFMLNTMGMLLLPALPAVAAALPRTPRQTAGPFYPLELSLDNDNDLTQVQGFTRPALGKITDLSGRILASDGSALTGMRIEIWQCDANGRSRATATPTATTRGVTDSAPSTLYTIPAGRRTSM